MMRVDDGIIYARTFFCRTKMTFNIWASLHFRVWHDEINSSYIPGILHIVVFVASVAGFGLTFVAVFTGAVILGDGCHGNGGLHDVGLIGGRQ